MYNDLLDIIEANSMPPGLIDCTPQRQLVKSNTIRPVTEQWDLEAAKYIMSLTFTDFCEKFTDSWKAHENGEQMIEEKKAYYRHVCRQCRIRVQSGNSAWQPEYKFAKNNCTGRIYAMNGLQNLSMELKKYLLPDDMVDYDMKNCHPTLLLKLSQLLQIHTPYLSEYVNNRKTVLQENNLTKKDILVQLYCDRKRSKNNEFLEHFNKEIKIVQSKMYELFAKLQPNGDSTKNPKGSLTAYVLNLIESKILETVLATSDRENYNYIRMFDGFMSNENIAIENLDLISKHWGTTWTTKAWEKAVIPEGETLVEGSYEACKTKWEEKGAFWVVNPKHTFYYDGNKRGVEEMKLLAKQYTYIDGNGKKCCVFDQWLSDPDAAFYDELQYVTKNPLEEVDDLPTNGKRIKYVVREFPFDYIVKPFRHDHRLTEMFEQVVRCNVENEDGHDFVMNYVAHALQKPRESPQTAIVFKSLEGGTGKDTILATLQEIVGKDLTCRTSKMDLVFGKFNDLIEDAFIVQINEVKGKDGTEHVEAMKDYITSDEIHIHAKHQSVSKAVANNFRWFFATNNHNALEPDRRYYLAVSPMDKLLDVAFFDEYYKLLKQPEQINCLASTLMDRDLSTYDPRKPPNSINTTERHTQKIRPIHYVLQLLCEKKIVECTHVLSETEIGIKAKDLRRHVKSYDNYSDNKQINREVSNWMKGMPGAIQPSKVVKLSDKTTARLTVIDTNRCIQTLKKLHRYTEEDQIEDVQDLFS